jgi:hypothetical protein
MDGRAVLKLIFVSRVAEGILFVHFWNPCPENTSIFKI